MEDEDLRWWWERWILNPKRSVVRAILGSWWRRMGVLIVLPAVVTIVWCAIPFPTYPLELEPLNGTATASQVLSSYYHESLLPSPGFSDHPTNTTFSLFLSVLRRNLLALSTVAPNDSPPPRASTGPGHGEALVRLNFWFFLFVYYGIYNLIGLLWITKLFNLYSLNWWPPRLGFALSYTIFWAMSLLLAVPLYLDERLIKWTSYNLTWILLTFATMTWPMWIAFGVLVSEHRHVGLRRRYVPSETQALFAPSPQYKRGTVQRGGRYFLHSGRSGGWSGGRGSDESFNIHEDHLTPSQRGYSTRFPRHFNYLSTSTAVSTPLAPVRRPSLLPRPPSYHFDLPASYIRFLYFLSLLLLTLLAYLLGESYSELYLRTLPHNNIETLIYVYSWILTIHILDFSTSYIITTHINSYPLEWVFKLFFALTYQIFVRALYARLRSPEQFLLLLALSAVGKVGWYTVTFTALWHRCLDFLNLTGDRGKGEYRRYVGRGFWIRQVAESVSMVAWVGWVAVLHWGDNRRVYPYFAFESGKGGWWPEFPGGSGGNGEGGDSSVAILAGVVNMVGMVVGGGEGSGDGGVGIQEEKYTFELTFFASLATWASELVANRIVTEIMRRAFNYDVEKDARRVLIRYPELVGAGVVVGVHVLQNMLVGIVRVRFY
ncbi:hypothetical protein BDZ91DRAFT_734111 [Kalaharituber pfeilii]|nr:hypothetical protein BDZ91DRAFT_734111 [Kalaharituber pfeilii]